MKKQDLNNQKQAIEFNQKTKLKYIKIKQTRTQSKTTQKIKQTSKPNKSNKTKKIRNKKKSKLSKNQIRQKERISPILQN